MARMVIGFIQGSYDMLHLGHVVALEKARAMCDFLIVGLNSDKLYKNYKQKIPVYNFSARKRMLLSLKCVDQVISASEGLPLRYLKRYNADIYFICKEWVFDKQKEIAYMKNNGKRIIILPYFKGVSSSSIRDEYIQNIIRHQQNYCAECHRRI